MRALVLLVVVAGCAETTDAAAPVLRATLYQRLGGQAGVVALVEEFVGNVGGDARINGFFAKRDVRRVKAFLTEQLCQAAGGPCSYSGRDMRAAHTGLHLTNAHFDALLEDMARALDKLRVAVPERREILDGMAGLRKEIVGL
jgi:hemoglobin